MHCQLCGYEFDATNMACHTACPLGSRCSIICCPNCGYQVVDESRSWMVQVLSNWWKPAQPGAESRPQLHENRCVKGLLSEAPVGIEVEVRQLAPMPAARLARLSVFGLIPGSRVTVLQHQPVPILSIGETELSLSRDFLEQIWVQSPQDIREFVY